MGYPAQRKRGNCTVNVFISKYALTRGIYEEKGAISKIDEFRFYAKDSFHDGFSKDEWHKTRGEAVARAEEMRKKKLASLHKQISKLEALKFD